MIIRKIEETINQEIPKINSQLEQKTNEMKYITNTSVDYNMIATFIIDDGDTDFEINGYKRCFDDNNVKGTLAIVTRAVEHNLSNKMSLTRLKELQEEGWDIVSHSATHGYMFKDSDSNNDTSYNAIYNELKESYDFVTKNGFNNEVFVYPFGDFKDKDKYTAITKKVYKYGVNATGKYNKSPIDTMYLQRCSLEGSLENIKGTIDECYSNNGWIIFLIHTYVTPLANIQGAIDYLKSKNVKIAPFSEASKQKANILSINNIDNGFYIGNDGSHNLMKNINKYSTTKVDINKKITEYEEGITQEIVGNSDAINFPNKSAGNLITHRHALNLFNSYQTYFLRASNVSFTRWWVLENGVQKWSEFKLQNVTIYNEFDAINVAVDKFEVGTSISIVGSSTQANFPEGKPGVLETNRHGGNRFYSYQDYHIRGENKTYKRWWILDNTDNVEKWSEFTLVSGNLTYNKNSITVDSKYTEFEVGLSFSIIGSSTQSSFPEGKPGVLETNRHDTNRFYTYQQYHIRGENKVYKRWWILDGIEKWSQFTLV